MKKVLLYSALLVVGLGLSQVAPSILGANYELITHLIKMLTMAALAFIMIHVGYEFEIDKSRLRQYGWDYLVAATAAGFPWLFCAVYFVLVFYASADWRAWDAWQESLLAARFAAPTSAGVLFSMLAAAGLAATWMFRKTRILAIFDDLDTVLLMIPLKMMIVGLRWQLAVIIVIMFALLWLAWRHLHVARIPVTWPWVMGYSLTIMLVCEGVYLASKLVDEVVPVHIEVLLPAFVLGCIIRKPGEHGRAEVPSPDLHHDDVLERPKEKRVTTIVSACFMVLVGLSMPPVAGLAGSEDLVAASDKAMADAYVIPDAAPAIQPSEEQMADRPSMGWGAIAAHVIAITALSNLGKMFPVLCYRREAHWKQRLAVAVAMFPRGEVGAGVLIISLSYGIGGAMITVAMLSLALNLLLTGLFIVAVKRLLGDVPAPA